MDEGLAQFRVVENQAFAQLKGEEGRGAASGRWEDVWVPRACRPAQAMLLLNTPGDLRYAPQCARMVCYPPAMGWPASASLCLVG